MSPHRFAVIIERDAQAQVWVTYVPALGHLSTYGDTREEALRPTREAIVGHLEAAAMEGIALPSATCPPEVVELEVAAP